jgi:hypothetical protein
MVPDPETDQIQVILDQYMAHPDPERALEPASPTSIQDQSQGSERSARAGALG